METKKPVYRTPEVEVLMTGSESPLCTSALGVDPFTGVPIGNEL